ncbi:MAG: hypothetical protein Q9161_006432 [Pseudevernia consocians]
MLIDIDGNPDDKDGADVTLALALGNPDGPEREDAADPEGVPTAVLFEETLGSPDEDVGIEELADPIETADGELGMAGADLGGPLIGNTGGAVAADSVEFDDPPGAFVAEVKKTAVALGVILAEGMLEAEAVELTETTGGPEETAVPEVEEEALRTTLLEGEGLVAALLGDNGTLVLVGAVPLEADTVVAFAGEGRTVTVVVVPPKAVPESVCST